MKNQGYAEVEVFRESMPLFLQSEEFIISFIVSRENMDWKLSIRDFVHSPVCPKRFQKIHHITNDPIALTSENFPIRLRRQLCLPWQQHFLGRLPVWQKATLTKITFYWGLIGHTSEYVIISYSIPTNFGKMKINFLTNWDSIEVLLMNKVWAAASTYPCFSTVADFVQTCYIGIIVVNGFILARSKSAQTSAHDDYQGLYTEQFKIQPNFMKISI